MTTSFYTPPENIRGNVLILPEDESHHAARVLRVRPGEEIVVVDGAGGWYRAVVGQVDRGSTTASIVETRRNAGEPSYELTIAAAPLKNPSRFETFLEKAVEFGVSRIVPLLTERTEKMRIKEARAQNILLAAMKQCGRSRLAVLEEPCSFAEYLSALPAGLVLLCHEAVHPDHSITHVLENHASTAHITVLVGPEGGFTQEEVTAATSEGCIPVSLGPRRLRAETAAMAAAAAVMLFHA